MRFYTAVSYCKGRVIRSMRMSARVVPSLLSVSSRQRNVSVSFIGTEVLLQRLQPSGSWKVHYSSEAIFGDSSHYGYTLRVGRQPFRTLTPGVQQTACVVSVMYGLLTF